MMSESVGVVVIGRNEGERLKKCLYSIDKGSYTAVYVDSGSSDKSVEFAKKLGIHVHELDMNKPFTAARARNQGFKALLAISPKIKYVQFIDGDCEVVDGWFEHALSTFFEIEGREPLAIVFGRCKERFPEASIYNYEADRGWQIQPGYTETSGGNFFILAKIFSSMQGFNETLIAGEEPELCLRIRRAGWKILSVPHDMVWHDVNLHSFYQWCKRSIRTGYAFAEVAWMHRKFPEKYWFLHNIRIFGWGIFLPLLLVSLSFFNIFFLVLFLIYPVQLGRVASKESWLYACFCIVGKFPQAIGQGKYILNRLLGKQSKLIEYK